jgi:Carboxypeptidase regulatory-like domain
MLSVLRMHCHVVTIGAILMLPTIVYAQEATVNGTVTDSTGGVLPGVTVTALHEASGNTFVGITDERGEFRILVRTGGYRVAAELQGFATVARSGLELLVGQQAVVNFQLSPSTVQESVTVTGEAPLIDVTQSRLAGNVDPRQLSELPLNGRNWVNLTLLAPGSRANAVGSSDELLPRNTGTFQLNIDGQQVTNTVAFTQGQPHFSRDAIAEFEFVSNRFDATQGRSSGVQVNAITKSGTNTPAGTFSGYFRDDRFNAGRFHPTASTSLFKSTAEQHVRGADPEG